MIENPECPRCAYDLKGIVSSWRDAPPETGICSECGLDIRWAEVLDPKEKLIPWFIEHAVPGAPLISKVLGTWRRVALPWVFWEEVGLRFPASRWRRAFWLLLSLAVFHLIAAITTTITLANVPTLGYPRFPFQDMMDLWLGPVWHIISSVGPEFVGNLLATPIYPIQLLLAISLGMPIGLLLLARTRKGCKVQAAHVWRAGVYGFAWYGALLAFEAFVQAQEMFRVLVFEPGSFLYGWGEADWIGYAVYDYRWYWGPAMIVWTAVWWWFAIARGFRLPNATTVWGMLMLVCLLIGGSLLLLNPLFLFEYFG